MRKAEGSKEHAERFQRARGVNREGALIPLDTRIQEARKLVVGTQVRDDDVLPDDVTWK